MAGRGRECGLGSTRGNYCFNKGVGTGIRKGAAVPRPRFIVQYLAAPKGPGRDLQRISGIGPTFARLIAMRYGIRTRAALVQDLNGRTRTGRRDRIAQFVCGPTSQKPVESSFEQVVAWLRRNHPTLNVAPMTNATRRMRCIPKRAGGPYRPPAGAKAKAKAPKAKAPKAKAKAKAKQRPKTRMILRSRR